MKTTDTQSESFKDLIKLANMESPTALEKHKLNQEEFRQLMPILASLTEEECEILVHMIRNKGRELNNETRRSHLLTDNACSDDFKTKLAKMSEEENFNLKNRWMHNKKTMKYADKKRMPVDKSKVVDLLRHQNVFKDKIINELDTYWEY